MWVSVVSVWWHLLSKVHNYHDVVNRDNLRLSLTTLNIMPIMNTIFLVVHINYVLYPNKYLKTINIKNKSNINIF
jgi:uncharacterized lipoprotein YddW (UPF0748 family)